MCDALEFCILVHRLGTKLKSQEILLCTFRTPVGRKASATDILNFLPIFQPITIHPCNSYCKDVLLLVERLEEYLNFCRTGLPAD